MPDPASTPAVSRVVPAGWSCRLPGWPRVAPPGDAVCQTHCFDDGMRIHAAARLRRRAARSPSRRTGRC